MTITREELEDLLSELFEGWLKRKRCYNHINGKRSWIKETFKTRFGLLDLWIPLPSTTIPCLLRSYVQLGEATFWRIIMAFIYCTSYTCTVVLAWFTNLPKSSVCISFGSSGVVFLEWSKFDLQWNYGITCFFRDMESRVGSIWNKTNYVAYKKENGRVNKVAWSFYGAVSFGN
jgi:hypothetical protein